MSVDAKKWLRVWTAPQSITNCSLRGWQYTVLCERVFGVGFSEVHFVFENGLMTHYRSKIEQKHFSAIIGQSFSADHNRAKDVVSRALEFQAKLLEMLQENNFASEGFFLQFRELYDHCAPYILATKWACREFSKTKDRVMCFVFEGGYRQTGPFQPAIENFFKRYQDLMAMTIGVSNPEIFKTVRPKELMTFLRTWQKPITLSLENLEERYDLSLLSVVGRHSQLFVGEEARNQIDHLGLETNCEVLE